MSTSDLAGTMQAAVLTAFDQDLSDPIVEMQELPTPTPGPGEVLVRVGAAGVCRTDLHLAQGMAIGGRPAPLPHVLGHENAGWVALVGPGVQGLRVGQPVLCYPFRSAGLSLEERYGLDSRAPDKTTTGITSPGGFAEYLVTDARCLITLPRSADLAVFAPMADAGLTAYRAVRSVEPQLRPGHAVVVLGVGGVGHLGVQMLSRLAGVEVIAADPSRSARNLADAAGALAVRVEEVEGAVTEATDGRGVQAVVDFVGEDDSAALALRVLGLGGAYCCVGIGGTLRVPTVQLVEREWQVRGSFTGTYTDLVEVCALVTSVSLVPEVVRYPLTDAARALADLAAGSVTGRAVLVPDPN